MITVLCAILLAGCGGGQSPAGGTQPGWIDFARVRAESALGKRLTSDDSVFDGSRQQETDKVLQQLSAAEKAKDRDLESKRAIAQQKIQQFNAEIKAHEDQDVSRLFSAIQPVVARLAKERRMVTVDLMPGGRLWSAEDLTDEVILRLNAADSEGIAAKLAKAEAENAALKAAKAADKTTTKGTSP